MRLCEREREKESACERVYACVCARVRGRVSVVCACVFVCCLQCVL